MTLEEFLKMLGCLPKECIAVRGDGAGTCIETTRAFIRICKHFGFNAEPLAVSCAVVNDNWSVGVGFDESKFTPEAVQILQAPKAANGHLVVWLPEHRVLIDPTLHATASRPQHGLVIGAMVRVTVPPEFDAGDACSFGDGSVTITYQRSDWDGWRFSHAWQGDKAANKSYSNMIIAGLEQLTPSS